MKKRILNRMMAAFLCLSLALSALPMSVFAEGEAMPFYFTSLTTPSPKISSSPYGMWVLPHSALASRLALS